MVFLLISGFALHAQELEAAGTQTKEVEIQDSPLHPLLKKNQVIQDSRIAALLQQHIAANKRRNGMEGYRLEIFSNSSQNARGKALAVKTDFLKRFPDMDAYIHYQSPDFRVRIGDFRTKSEASKAKERIKQNYPNAFRVDDIIQFPKLITEKGNNE